MLGVERDPLVPLVARVFQKVLRVVAKQKGLGGQK